MGGVVCPRRHLLSSKLRLDILRSLLCPGCLHSTFEAATDGDRRRPHRIADRRSASGLALKLIQKRSGNRIDGIIRDKDVLSLLEDAESRTRARRESGVLRDEDALALVENAESRTRAKRERGVFRSEDALALLENTGSNTRGKKEKKAANTQSQTKKQTEEEEAAALLKEAAQRVTTPQIPNLPKDPADERKSSSRVSSMRNPVKVEEDDAALLREAAQRATTQMPKLPKDPVDERRSSSSVSSMQNSIKKDKNTAVLFGKPAQRVTTQMSTLTKYPADQRRSSSSASSMQNLVGEEEEAASLGGSIDLLDDRQLSSTLRCDRAPFTRVPSGSNSRKWPSGSTTDEAAQRRVPHRLAAHIEKSILPASDSIKERIPGLVSDVSRQPRNLFSSLERAQLSSLLSSPDAESPSLSASLPLSPYQRLQAQERRMKQPPTKEGRRRLQDNPWAEWLASPVRMCQASGVRLPRKLMVGWSCVRNPKDDLIYLMPAELSDVTPSSTGSRINSSSGPTSGEGLVEETESSGDIEIGNSQKAAPTPASDYGSRSVDVVYDQVRVDDGKNSNTMEEVVSGQHKRTNPTQPAKIYMRPSSALVVELNKKIIPKGDRGLMNDDFDRAQPNKTNAAVLNRLFPNRWRDQARRFEKSAEAKNSQSGFLITEQMRNVRWYPHIHGVMLDLMRLRVLKTLENIVVMDSHHTGTKKRIIPLPSVTEADSSDKDAISTNISGVEQAVLLYFGTADTSEIKRQYSQNATRPPLQSSPLHPLTSHNFTLQFISRKTPTEITTPCPDNAQDQSRQAFIPIWGHTAPATTVSESAASQQHQKYIPRSITVHIPPYRSADNLDNNNNSNGNNDTTPTLRNLPIFDLRSLLGDPYMTKLQTLSDGNRVTVHDTLGLNRNDASGWVMVKGGRRTGKFKPLVHEMWRLWLFVGGRAWGEDTEEDV